MRATARILNQSLIDHECFFERDPLGIMSISAVFVSRSTGDNARFMDSGVSTCDRYNFACDMSDPTPGKHMRP